MSGGSLSFSLHHESSDLFRLERSLYCTRLRRGRVRADPYAERCRGSIDTCFVPAPLELRNHRVRLRLQVVRSDLY